MGKKRNSMILILEEQNYRLYWGASNSDLFCGLFVSVELGPHYWFINVPISVIFSWLVKFRLHGWGTGLMDLEGFVLRRSSRQRDRSNGHMA